MYAIYNQEFYHHGILGMKWGIRRFQNSDGSLTDAGKKRYYADSSGRMTKRTIKEYNKEAKEKMDKADALYSKLDRHVIDVAKERSKTERDKYDAEFRKEFKKTYGTDLTDADFDKNPFLSARYESKIDSILDKHYDKAWDDVMRQHFITSKEYKDFTELINEYGDTNLDHKIRNTYRYYRIKEKELNK